MTYNYDTDKNMITITDGANTVQITPADLRNINDLINEQIWFKEDVMVRISEMVEEGLLDESYLTNDEYIGDVLNEYKQLRNKYDGDAEGLTWIQCLNEAFENCPVEDYEHDNIEK